MRYNLAITAACLAATSYALPGPASPSSGIFARGGAPNLEGLPAEVQAAFPGKPVFVSDFSGPAGAFQSPAWEYYNATGKVETVNKERQIYPQTGQPCELTGQGGLQFTPKRNPAGKIISCRLSSTDSWQAQKGEKIIFAANIKLGTGTGSINGFWPAFWALGQSMRSGTEWPFCGEIDTMENINAANEIHSTVHCGPACNDPTGIPTTAPYTMGQSATFAHVIDRTVEGSETITFYVNGQSLKEIKQGDVKDAASWTALAHSPFFIVMNVAIGGEWPESATKVPFDINLPLGPETGMLVNWVQVLKSSVSGAAPVGGPAVVARPARVYDNRAAVLAQQGAATT